MKQVRLSAQVDELLTKLSEARKNDGALVRTKQDIVAELIIAQHKKEIGAKRNAATE